MCAVGTPAELGGLRQAHVDVLTARSDPDVWQPSRLDYSRLPALMRCAKSNQPWGKP